MMRMNPMMILAAAWLCGQACAAGIEKYYTLQNIATPAGVTPECGGIAFSPSGKLFAAFHAGEVHLYDPVARVWRKFAEGLHDPMGIVAINDSEVVVSQRPELTRLRDTDGDGTADHYQVVSDAWGMSGNYHEFASSVSRDAAGNFYLGVGNASNGGPARYEKRGRYEPRGENDKSHYSVSPYRGWAVKVAPDGRFTPIAPGFRQPNGVGLDAAGRLLVADNQGDWVGSSKLFHVEHGRFYGHAPSLVWSDLIDSATNPSQLPIERLEALRTEAAVIFPHALMASSPGQIIVDTTGGKFGPFAGQTFIPEYQQPRVMRVMLETVAGRTQGAAVPFYDLAGLRLGSHRAAFSPDGSLWVAQSQRKLGWPADEGIQRIVWNGITPLDVADIHLTDSGFELSFTRPVDPAALADPASYSVRRYYYLYQPSYGSPQVDVLDIKITAAVASQDGRKVSLRFDRLDPGYIYEFRLSNLKASDGGDELVNNFLCYTCNVLLDGTAAPYPRPKPTGKTIGSGKDKPDVPGVKSKKPK
jgi:glucose/arabinose dehydrogenase